MKLGRNAPCHCGSGKKCCLPKDELTNPATIARLRETLLKQMAQQKEKMEKKDIFMNYVKPISHNGKRVFAIGTRVYYERPEHETFEEFILFNLYQVFGQDWLSEQRKKPEKN